MCPIFDINNPPLIPDSELDSDLANAQTYSIQGGDEVIALGDWVDLDSSYVTPDRDWGLSFQVVGLNPNSVTVLMYNDGLQVYVPSEVTPSIITNNFRRVPRV